MTASRETISTEPLSTRRELELLRDLQRLANERAREEQRIGAALSDGLEAAEKARDAAAAEIERQFTERRSAATNEYEQATGTARQRYEDDRNAAQQEYKGLRQGVESELSRVKEAAQNEQQNASWEALTVFDALKGQPREKFLATVQQLKRSNQELAVLERDAIEILKMRRQWREFPPVAPSPDGAADSENGQPEPAEPVEAAAAMPAAAQRGWKSLPQRANSSNHVGQAAGPDAVEPAMQRVAAQTTAVREAAVELQRQKFPRLFEGGMPFGVFFGVWVIAAAPCALAIGWQNWIWIAASLAIAVAATGGLLAWLWPIARGQSGRQFQTIQQRLADARQGLRIALEAARERGEREAQSLVAERDEHLSSVEKKLHALVGERERWKEGEMGRAGQTFPQRLAQLRGELDHSLAETKQRHATALALVTETRDRRAGENRSGYERRVREVRAEYDRDWLALRERWRTGLAELNDAWDRIRGECERLFPDWNVTEFDAWPKPTEPAPAIQFGAVTLDLAQVKNGVPQDERLRPAETTMRLPAMMTLEEHPVLLITAEEEGRREAIDVLQLMMLRILTAMPPGKVRFTILDPVGLGENFASFMHLADFDEQLIASRIWTEGRQIDEQLTRLTAHMETVLQKYLRNEFATIHEYNAQAGEVAEPFQVLVVANFPTNFSEAAARKLVSIATSGPRCGVYTLIMVDRKQKMPANFDLKDLEAGAVHLDWVAEVERQRAASFDDDLPSGGSPSARPQPAGNAGFRWRYPAFEHLPLALDRPPIGGAVQRRGPRGGAGGEGLDEGRSAVRASRAGGERLLERRQRQGAGRADRPGRARRLQSVRLGKGTSQHLLVAGKTGSGKSTFLHALITNTALIYGPDQVEFYLIDFKKGVEFKTYATHRLPHARVIAIESEREFGLSVLERLDAELRRRGELFRAAGVQDLPDLSQSPAGNGDAAGAVDCRRVSRTVRRGRQARAGRGAAAWIGWCGKGARSAFTCCSVRRRSAARIRWPAARWGRWRCAWRCSAARPTRILILSDERNEAARFLSRPGEAIYNDQNGLLAGNHPFQVVWLAESQRD